MQTYAYWTDITNALSAVALDFTNGLDAAARSDLVAIAALPVPPQRAVYGMERLYQEYCGNPAITDSAKQVTGGLAQFVDSHNLYANGQGDSSRAYAIWQTELAREGSANADPTVSRPEPLKTYNDNGPGFVTVPFPPVLTSVAPTSGPTNATTNLILIGSGFTGATGVTLGDATLQFLINSDTEITAVAPGGAAGTGAIVVSNGGGASGAANVMFAYVAPATAASTSSTTTSTTATATSGASAS